MQFIGFGEEEDKKLTKYFKKLGRTKQEWKDICIHDEKSKYQVSNLGEIRNIKTGEILRHKMPRNFFTYQDILLRQHGYLYKFYLHRVVCHAFHPIPEKYLEQGLTEKDLVPNHINGLKGCNAAFNLEWTSSKDNSRHAWSTGLCDVSKGENSHLAKITEKTAKKIIRRILKGKTNKEIAKELRVTKKTIQHIRSKECWKHLTKDLEFPKLAPDLKNTIPIETIHAICKELELGTYSDTYIAQKYNVSREYVRDIRLHKLQKKISSLYHF